MNIMCMCHSYNLLRSCFSVYDFIIVSIIELLSGLAAL